MKKPFLPSIYAIALLFIVSFASCDKDEEINSPIASSSELIGLTFKDYGSESLRIASGFTGACAVQEQELVIGQKEGLGKVSIYKKDAKLYVTLSINDNDDPWFIAKSSMFVGLVSELGVKKNPAPGKFPLTAAIASKNNTGDKEYTYELLLSDYEDYGTLHFVLHADIVKVKTDSYGQIIFTDGKAEIIQKEGAWGKGVRFNDEKGNWASYMVYDPGQSCAVACDPLWKGVSGGLVIPSSGNNDIETEIFYDFYSNGAPIGKVLLKVNKNGSGSAEFTLSSPADHSFEEVAFTVSGSTVTIADLSTATKITSPINGKWKIDFSNKFADAGFTHVYGAFSAIVNGICEK